MNIVIRGFVRSKLSDYHLSEHAGRVVDDTLESILQQDTFVLKIHQKIHIQLLVVTKVSFQNYLFPNPEAKFGE